MRWRFGSHLGARREGVTILTLHMCLYCNTSIFNYDT